MEGTNFEHAAMTDWPTLAAIAVFWTLLGCVVFAGPALGTGVLATLLVVVVLGVLGGFYMSLQHEVIHGHPTRSRRTNSAMVGIPLGLILPFSRYRENHVAHHNSDLTNPADDPESFYVLAATWDRAGRVKRALLTVNRTLAGRLLVGPFIAGWRGVAKDVRLSAHRADIRVAWLTHAVGVAIVLTVVYRSPLPILVYLVGFVYVGSALTSLRSFVEHKAPATGTSPDASRSAVVRSGWFFSLLFLNNNLHDTHHRIPGAAWYRLPELTEVLDAAALVADGAGAYDGYGSIVRRYLFRSFEQPVHPLSDSIKA